jgi:periodic tryptophan protein 1
LLILFLAREADDDLREYDLDNYDTDEDENTQSISMFGNPKALAYHDDNEDDPYLTLKDDDEEERDELRILRTDNMVAVGRVEDEVAHMEIYVYEDEADNLYVHHDIMLPAIPLCLEWLDIPVGKKSSGESADQSSKGNYIAVGTFEPDIEIWDLDTIDCMYPNAILGKGGEEEEAPEVESKKKKKKKKSKKANDNYHVDAVLALAANKNHRTLLASSSADKTIKLWDLSTTKCAKSYTHHTDKVCSIEWNPKETTTLLSGSYDRTVVSSDMRAPDAKVPRWGVESDVESVRWDPHDSNFFYITTESGFIHYHDVRMAPSSPAASKPVWKLQAHDEAVSSFDINPTIPGYLATGSTDKEVKLWNIQPSGPSMVVSRNLGVGRVFSTKFGPDPEVAFRLAVAGSQGSLQIWDTSTNPAVRRQFSTRIKGDNEQVLERLIVANDDSESSDSGSEAEENAKDGWESMDED